MADATPLKLTDQQYIESHDLRAHLSDALSIIWNAPSKVKPLEFLAAYFTLLSDPAHVFHRDFKYLNSTASSRLAFIALFRRVFLSVDGPGCLVDGVALSAESVHQLCCLICADFPFSLVRNAARITNESGGGSPSNGEMRFTEFAHKLFVLFFFSEFLNQCALTFRGLDGAGTGKVPRRAFLSRLKAVVEKRAGEFSCPPMRAIEQALAAPTSSSTATSTPATAATTAADKEERELVMFNSFCVDLFAHPLVRQAMDGASQ